MTTDIQKQGTVRYLRHESEVLNGNPPGDPHIRDFPVYLPFGYEDEGQNYPSVYCLTGFGGRGRMLVNHNPFIPNLAERMDRLIDFGDIKPMIVIMPDCFTYYGGSQYINSTATGNYENYLTLEIIQFIDQNLRTIPNRNSRAVMGISSGGYGSLIMGMRHADLFGLVCSISGDAYFEHSQMADFAKAFRAIKGDPKRFLEKFWNEEKKGKDDFAAFNAIGMSVCYSPNGDEFDLPFDLETGEIREDIWAKWLAHDPARLVEKSAENLKLLNLLYLTAGSRDEFALDLGARILSKKLRDFDIPHIHEEFDDGHFSISYRYYRSLKLISERIQTN